MFGDSRDLGGSNPSRRSVALAEGSGPLMASGTGAPSPAFGGSGVGGVASARWRHIP
jgi:hypothetical protein